MISLNAKKDTNNTFAEVRYTAGTRRFPQALKYFANSRLRFGYLPDFYRTRSQNEQRDTAQRIDDVNAYLLRYAQAVAQGVASQSDVLLPQRASRLYPDSPEVIRASSDAQRCVRSALDSYVLAVKAIQKGDNPSCRSAVSQSFATGVRIFHSDLLWRYCSNPGAQSFTQFEMGLLDAYRHQRADRLQEVLMMHPWVASLEGLPTIAALKNGSSYREQRTEIERSTDQAGPLK